MIIYLLIIMFFVLLLNKREHFLDIIDVYGAKERDKIYKGFYKCSEYIDLMI